MFGRVLNAPLNENIKTEEPSWTSMMMFFREDS